MCTCVYVYTCVVCVCVYMYLHMFYVCMSVYEYVHVCVLLCVYIHECVYTRVYVCVCIYFPSYPSFLKFSDHDETWIEESFFRFSRKSLLLWNSINVFIPVNPSGIYPFLLLFLNR